MADQSRLEIVIDSRGAERNLRNVRNELQGVERTGVSSLNKLRAAAVAVTGALAAIGVSGLARATFDAVASSQTLMASLETVTGSAEQAQSAWKDLVDFASNTPFNLDQSVQAFIRMKSLGLNPTESALESFGNTASAMGKDMMQMVEAVADATTGEFERLKEFGIRASKDGEEVAFTFQGTTTRIRNNADAISQYLEKIGNTQFAGAMADQMDTLRGQASNLEDSIGALYRAIGDAGATNVFTQGLSAASTAVQSTTEALRDGDLDGFLNTAASSAQALSIIVGTKLSAALVTAAGAKIKDANASIINARAESAAATQVARRTGAELASARALLSTTRLEVAATRGTNAHTFALQQLSVARTRAITAAGAHTAATNATTTAMARASVAARGLSGAMALVGGPAGVALLAAAGLFAFREELGLVPAPVKAARNEIDLLVGSLDDLNGASIDAAMIAINAQMFELERRAREARAEIDRINDAQNVPGPLRNSLVGPAGGARRELTDIQAQQSALSGRQDELLALREAGDEAAGALDKTSEGAVRLTDTAIQAAIAVAEYGGANGDASDAVDDFASSAERASQRLEAVARESDPRFSIGAGGDTVEARARARFEASAFRPGDASVINYAPAGGFGDTVQGSVGSSGPSDAAPKPRGSVHITVSKDGSNNSGEVEGDDEFIRQLAGALSGAASAS